MWLLKLFLLPITSDTINYYAVLFTLLLVNNTLSHLHTLLRHFEILTPCHLRVLTRRDARSVLTKSVKFKALGTNFHVSLQAGSPVIDESLRVKIINGTGRGVTVHIKKTALYVGRLGDDPESYVDASYVAGTWSMMIQGREVLFLEPLRKLDSRGRGRYMVIYRTKDIRKDNFTNDGQDYLRSLCKLHKKRTYIEESRGRNHNASYRFIQHTHLRHLFDKPPNYQPHNNVRQRSQRASSFYFNTCDMAAVMDTATFKGVGEGSTYKSAAMIIYWYQLADSIFKKTQFGIFRGMRLNIKSIYIMTNFTNSMTAHFNRDPSLGLVTPDQVMESLGQQNWLNHYCLAHLTTQRRFSDSVLGMASIANVPVFDPHKYSLPLFYQGMCAGRGNNIGFSCLRVDNTILPDAMYLVILTHEIGHGWGALHDDHYFLKECAPAEEDGGKYIMWAGHNGGKDVNSLKFSPCSASSIQEVLLYKAHKCLLPGHMTITNCGNSVIEPPEQCDEGIQPNSGCCTNNCRLRAGAICSPLNHPCCDGQCQTAPSTQRCYPILNLSCLQPAYCDGLNFARCPTSPRQPNGQGCEGRGTCWHGECLSYCGNKGRTSSPPEDLEPCTCDTDTASMCSMCCRVRGATTCVPTVDLVSEGTPCLIGFCKSGHCMSIFSMNVSMTTPAQSFAKKHIVYLVVVISIPLQVLLVWFNRSKNMNCKKKTKDTVIIHSKLKMSSLNAGKKIVF